jgi:hypothetical protein
MPKGTSQAFHTRFVPFAKGQTYAGSLEKATGTATRTAKARSGACANTKAQRPAVEPNTKNKE